MTADLGQNTSSTTGHAPAAPGQHPIIIGSLVSYHGSLTEYHNRTFLLLPGTDGQYLLADLKADGELRNVSPRSFTPFGVQWWQDDAIDIDISGYRYKASHASGGGSANSRTIHYFTATGPLRKNWCRFPQMTPEVRALLRALDNNAPLNGVRPGHTTNPQQPQPTTHDAHTRLVAAAMENITKDGWTTAVHALTGYRVTDATGTCVDIEVTPGRQAGDPVTLTLDLTLNSAYSVEGPQPFTIPANTTPAQASELLAAELRRLRDVAKEWARVASSGR